ncbi:MAG: N-acetylmuramoyl-L-alanine amidase, partial [Thermoplasmata archaeon]
MKSGLRRYLNSGAGIRHRKVVCSAGTFFISLFLFLNGIYPLLSSPLLSASFFNLYSPAKSVPSESTSGLTLMQELWENGTSAGIPASRQSQSSRNSTQGSIDLSGYCIVLDPGHGYYYSSSSNSWNWQRDINWGLREDLHNVEMARRLYALLAGTGARVLSTRELDYSAGSGRSGLPRWQEGAYEYLKDKCSYDAGSVVDGTDDLLIRAYYANEVGADIFISIHSNADNDPDTGDPATGHPAGSGTWQGFYTMYGTYLDGSSADPKDKRLADIVHPRLSAAISSMMEDNGIAQDIYLSGFTLAVLRETNMPAILFETGFHDNYTDTQTLLNSTFLDLWAQGVFEGIVSYLVSPLQGLRIALDPGHGGTDTGLTGIDGAGYPDEKDICLEIALSAGSTLNRSGAQIIYTRTTDFNVSLAERCTAANSANAHLFLSIHLNGGAADLKGAETYYYDSSSVSNPEVNTLRYRLADSIQRSVCLRVGLQDRGRKPDVETLGYHLYVLANTTMTAAQLYCGFITNTSDFELLSTGYGRECLGRAISDAFLDYFAVPIRRQKAPEIVFYGLGNGSILSGLFSISIIACDRGGIEYGRLRVDSMPWIEKKAFPYTFSINTELLPAGLHYIEAEVLTSSGGISRAGIYINILRDLSICSIEGRGLSSWGCSGCFNVTSGTISTLSYATLSTSAGSFIGVDLGTPRNISLLKATFVERNASLSFTVEGSKDNISYTILGTYSGVPGRNFEGVGSAGSALVRLAPLPLSGNVSEGIRYLKLNMTSYPDTYGTRLLALSTYSYCDNPPPIPEQQTGIWSSRWPWPAGALSNSSNSSSPAIWNLTNGSFIAAWVSGSLSNQSIMFSFSTYVNSTIIFGVPKTARTFNSSTSPIKSLSVVQALSGSLVIMYERSNGMRRSIFAIRSTDNGNSWSGEVELTSGTEWGNCTKPVLTRTAYGTLWAAFLSDRDSNSEVYYTISSDSGQTWSSYTRATFTQENETAVFPFQFLNGTELVLCLAFSSMNYSDGSYEINMLNYGNTDLKSDIMVKTATTWAGLAAAPPQYMFSIYGIVENLSFFQKRTYENFTGSEIVCIMDINVSNRTGRGGSGNESEVLLSYPAVASGRLAGNSTNTTGTGWINWSLPRPMFNLLWFASAMSYSSNGSFPYFPYLSFVSSLQSFSSSFLPAGASLRAAPLAILPAGTGSNLTGSPILSVYETSGRIYFTQDFNYLASESTALNPLSPANSLNPFSSTPPGLPAGSTFRTSTVNFTFNVSGTGLNDVELIFYLSNEPVFSAPYSVIGIAAREFLPSNNSSTSGTLFMPYLLYNITRTVELTGLSNGTYFWCAVARTPGPSGTTTGLWYYGFFIINLSLPSLPMVIDGDDDLLWNFFPGRVISGLNATLTSSYPSPPSGWNNTILNGSILEIRNCSLPFAIKTCNFNSTTGPVIRILNCTTFRVEDCLLGCTLLPKFNYSGIVSNYTSPSSQREMHSILNSTYLGMPGLLQLDMCTGATVLSVTFRNLEASGGAGQNLSITPIGIRGKEKSFWNSHTILNCSIDGEDVLYLVGLQNSTVLNSSALKGEIIVADCCNMTFRDTAFASSSSAVIAFSHKINFYGCSFAGINASALMAFNCSGMDIADNIFSGNAEGLVLTECSNLSVVRNIFENNTGYGLISILCTGTANNNTFISNNICTLNFTTGREQLWADAMLRLYEPRWGNWYSDLQGPDADEDGVVDIPYPAAGAAEDLYPLSLLPSANRPPRIISVSVSPASGYENEMFYFSASAMDEDGYIATALWQSNISGSLSSNLSFSTHLEAGVHNITFTATDNRGANRSAYILVSVLPVPNSIPVATVVSVSSTQAYPGEEIVLSGAGTDEDGYIDGFMWYYLTDENHAYILSEQPVLHVNFTSSGNYTLFFKVMDNEGEWSEAVLINITILPPPNIIPHVVILTIPPIYPLEPDSGFLIEAAAYDEDGYIVKWEWYSNLSGFLGNTSFINISTSPLSGPPYGTHNISVRVQDNNSSWSEFAYIQITVLPPNKTPRAFIISPNATFYYEGELIEFKGYGLDEDGEVVEYLWVSSSGVSSVNLSKNSSFSSGFPAGVYNISFSVKDNRGSWSSPVFFVLNVSVRTKPPEAPEYIILLARNETEAKLMLKPSAGTAQLLLSLYRLYIENGNESKNWVRNYTFSVPSSDSSSGGSSAVSVNITISDLEPDREYNLTITPLDERSTAGKSAYFRI